MKKIVTIGGGTGSYILLSGLKRIPSVSLSAIVTMADDGGSTGELRKKWKVMPAGDTRQCLAALASFGGRFLNKRISYGPFAGHKTGNLILAVLEKVTGDFSRGLKLTSFIFRATGKIIPITKDNAVLCLETKNGLIEGESNIDKSNLQSTSGEDAVERIFYKKEPKLNESTTVALTSADYIIVCPGNLYCSILPNFIVNGFRDTIQKANAKIILILNLVNRQGHTMGWSTERYVSNIEKYLGKRIDFILLNNRKFTPEQEKNYLSDAGEKVFISDSFNDPRLIAVDLLSEFMPKKDLNDTVERSLIRHDSGKLSNAIEKIIKLS